MPPRLHPVRQPRRLRSACDNSGRRHPESIWQRRRNPLRNTAFYQTDLALNKKFSTPVEGLKVEFRTECYNLLNHTNLYLPSTIGGTNGANGSTGGIITSTFTPRVIQFGLKLLY